MLLFYCIENQGEEGEDIITAGVEEISSCQAPGSTQFPNDEVKSRIFWEESPRSRTKTYLDPGFLPL